MGCGLSLCAQPASGPDMGPEVSVRSRGTSPPCQSGGAPGMARGDARRRGAPLFSSERAKKKKKKKKRERVGLMPPPPSPTLTRPRGHGQQGAQGKVRRAHFLRSLCVCVKCVGRADDGVERERETTLSTATINRPVLFHGPSSRQHQPHPSPPYYHGPRQGAGPRHRRRPVQVLPPPRRVGGQEEERGQAARPPQEGGRAGKGGQGKRGQGKAGSGRPVAHAPMGGEHLCGSFESRSSANLGAVPAGRPRPGEGAAAGRSGRKSKRVVRVAARLRAPPRPRCACHGTAEATSRLAGPVCGRPCWRPARRALSPQAPCSVLAMSGCDVRGEWPTDPRHRPPLARGLDRPCQRRLAPGLPGGSAAGACVGLAVPPGCDERRKNAR